MAQGINLVTTEASTGEWIAYGDPLSARQYPMNRVGDMATIPLRAQYIRTGAAELTFTFP
ncbi:hypothetical protein HT749_04740 [Burkholderia cepacia]|uniref:hypothetical protein n=1 Tax=Burkholderia cepacia TaxID=292 RepID=UPI00157A8620|nr:hypothetical protein [Burkholderia cepacia]NTX42708.1 hypothetical protein [Burkholderia cepacia]